MMKQLVQLFGMLRDCPLKPGGPDMPVTECDDAEWLARSAANVGWLRCSIYIYLAHILTI